MLYATRYLGLSERITVHAFDSFEGMPPPRGDGDRDLIADNPFCEGEFRGRYEGGRRVLRGPLSQPRASTRATSRRR